MDINNVNMLIATLANKIPGDKLLLLKSKLESSSEDKFSQLQMIQLKDPTKILIFSIFLGSLGVDRFMLGQTGAGVGKLLTCGGLGIWTIIDWFTISSKTKEENFQKVMMML